MAWALSLAGLAVLLRSTVATCGEWIFPLDDAYIHLGLARSLVESGTWGVNPGEFASASSSPAWTALMALSLLVAGPSPVVALVGNAVALGIVCFAAAAFLRDAGASSRAAGATLLALVVAVPLPFLAGLGMEHVLHLGLVLALLRAVEAPATRTNVTLVAMLAAAATLTRYETTFVVVGLTIANGPRAWRPSLAAVAGSGCAILGFGAFSLSQAGDFLPNPILKKAWVARQWAAGLREACADGQALLALMLAISLLLAFGLDNRSRRRAVTFLVAAAAQLLFGRIGWLYRYEAWLIGLGVLVLVPALARRFRSGPAIVAIWILGLVLPDLGARTTAAWSSFVPGARFTLDADVTVARWIAADWPGVPVAVHDLGAAAFYTDNPLVDLAGLGTDSIARLHREGGLAAETLAPILDEHHIVFAVAGPDWMDGARPPAFREAARLVVPHPVFPGSFDIVIWSRHGDVVGLGSSLRSVAGHWPDRVQLVLPGDRTLPLGYGELVGAAVQVEAQGLSFYSNGEATFTSPEPGRLLLTVSGTAAAGRFPLVKLTVGIHMREVEAPEAGVVVDLGPVSVGELLTVTFDDDAVDAWGGDRNVTVRSIRIRP
ncbi:hypothetical protein LBMAG42_45350 [Deltaproteobacteria bacterium]|nr:hypothetical protein LBMAG42_45350 [Deltaproteobacteria bacterium]